MTPQVADIWAYVLPESTRRYLVMHITNIAYNEDFICNADLLCLDNGQYIEDYIWPQGQPAWRKVV